MVCFARQLGGSHKTVAAETLLGPPAGLADWLSLPGDPSAFKQGGSGQVMVSTILREIQRRVLISLKGLLPSELSCLLPAKIMASKRRKKSSKSFHQTQEAHFMFSLGKL